MICKKCKGEIDSKAVVCVHCGCKIKKPIYKKWWLWAIIAVIAIAVTANNGDDAKPSGTPEISNEASEVVQEKITYEIADLSVMIEDLKVNAMKAESKYQNKYVEFSAKIKSFDSDGAYITVEPVNADEWNFDTAMCYIKNEEQKNYLIEKNVGDIITVKGKVTSIGEVLGYSIDIGEVE